MKHLFLPLPFEMVTKAWDEWRTSHSGDVLEDAVKLIEVAGGCYLVTEMGRPPRVFIDLLKGFMENKSRTLSKAG